MEKKYGGDQENLTKNYWPPIDLYKEEREKDRKQLEDEEKQKQQAKLEEEQKLEAVKLEAEKQHQ